MRESKKLLNKIQFFLHFYSTIPSHQGPARLTILVCYCKKQIDVSFYICPLIDDDVCHNIVKIAVVHKADINSLSWFIDFANNPGSNMIPCAAISSSCTCAHIQDKMARWENPREKGGHSNSIRACLLPLSIPSSQCKFSQPFKKKTIEWCSEKWLFNQLPSEQTIYCQVLHTVWYISGERLKEKIEVDHSWEWKG